MTPQRRLPSSTPVTQVEFVLTDSSYPFVAASTLEDCTVIMEEFIPRGNGEYAEFFTVTGVEADALREKLAAHEASEATLLNEYDDGVLVEFTVTDDCPAVFLGEQGALPRDVYAVAGRGRVTAEIPDSVNASAVVDRFLDAHPDAELVAKREQPYVTPMFSHREYRHLVEENLTERQQEVLSAAHDAGYYEWPRDLTAEDLAEQLGISSATLHKHIRTAERELIERFFEEPDPQPSSSMAV